MERRWQFSGFIFMRIIFKSLSGVEEWSTISSVLLLSEQIVGIVSDLLIKCLVVWETFTLGEGEHCLGAGVVDGGVVFVWHLFFFLFFYNRT